MSALPQKPVSQDLSGARLLGGRIELVERLGAGAFGAVYRAQECVLGQPLRMVAVKLTHRTHLTPEEARESLQEGFTLARIAAHCRDGLARPHLIQVFDLGIADDLDGRAYIVLEFVPGVLLMKHIDKYGRQMPMPTIRRYFLQMCRAIAACHALDPPITHGDLKPDNILVDFGQTVRIVDFGLARPVDRLAGYAVDPGMCLNYCAPEVLLGRGLPQSDMYSLGLVMYELLTGGGPHQHIEPPADAGNRYYYHQKKHAMRFASLASEYRGLVQDEALFRIVERCLRFHPEDRFGSLREIMELLGEAETDEGQADESSDRRAGDVSLPVTNHVMERYRGADAPRSPMEEPDWQSRAERCLLAQAWQEGLDVVHAHAAIPAAGAYEAVFLAELGRSGEALQKGLNILTCHGRTLPEPLRLRLIASLQAALTAADPAIRRQYEVLLRNMAGR
jgi:serine/threonine protein kinase